MMPRFSRLEIALDGSALGIAAGVFTATMANHFVPSELLADMQIAAGRTRYQRGLPVKTRQNNMKSLGGNLDICLGTDGAMTAELPDANMR